MSSNMAPCNRCIFTVPAICNPITDTRNTEFNDRAANDPTPTQTVELGAFNDAHEVSSTVASTTQIQDAYDTINMEVFSLDSALNREYLLQPTIWASNQASGTLLSIYEFPKFLLDQPFLKSKTADFRYLVAGVRISIRVASTKMNYGHLLACWEPWADQNKLEDDSDDLFVASGNPHVILKAETSGAVIMDVPFVSLYRALDLQNYTDAEIGRLKLLVMNELNNTTATPCSVEVLVKAQFLPAKLFLPHSAPTAEELAARAVRFRFEQTESMAEAHLKSTTGSLADKLAIGDTVKGVVSTVPKVKAKTIFNTVETAATLGAIAGLSKPGNISTSNPVDTANLFDLTLGKGLDNARTMGFDPENAISVQPNMGGVGVDEMTLLHVAGTPQLVNVTFTNADSQRVLLFDPNTTTSQTYFLAFINNLFQRKCGSYKIRIYICASQFHAVRGVLKLSDDIDGNYTNCYHQYVDVEGATEVEYTIPYTEQKFVAGNTLPSNFKLYWETQSWSQPTEGVDLPIWFNVYVSAAPDMRWYGLKEVGFVRTESCPREDFSHDFPSFHPSFKDFTHKGLVFGEEYSTLREVLHKYQPYFNLSGGLSFTQQTYPSDGYNIGHYIGLEMIGMLFRFWRGGINIALLRRNFNGNTAFAYIRHSVGDTGILATLAGGNGVTPTIRFTVPYYYDTPLQETTPFTNKSIEFVLGSTAPYFLAKAAADDFSFHWLKGPPKGNFVALGNSYGLKGLITAANTA